MRQLYSDLKVGEWPENIIDDLGKIFGSVDEVGSDVAHRLWEGRFPLTMDVSVELEQAPNPESRVKLSSAQDAMGLNQVLLDWKFTKLEKRSALAFIKTIGKEFGRLGLGRVMIRDWLLEDNDEWGEDLHGSFHHLGTTRMTDDPKRGVVDRNCRVHGVYNLYIAGGSVFATAGATNPTLTIVALSLRLADHLKKELGL